MVDGGFTTTETNTALEDLADEIYIASRQETGSQRTRRRRRRYRTGAEGRISHLKRGYGLRVAVLLAAPVAVRRRWPAATVVWASAVLLLQDPFRGQLFNLPSGSVVLVLMLCSYGAGAWLGSRRSVLAFAAAAALLVADQLIETYVTDVAGGNLSGIATLMVLFTAPWVLGRFVNARDRRAAAFSSLAAQAATERTERQRAAAAHEEHSSCPAGLHHPASDMAAELAQTEIAALLLARGREVGADRGFSPGSPAIEVRPRSRQRIPRIKAGAPSRHCEAAADVPTTSLGVASLAPALVAVQ
jgi:hypothetical protein